MESRLKYPYVRLPKKIDQILLLLCEELKNNRFFNNIEKIGFDDYSSRSQFTFVILDSIFGEAPDDLTDLYLTLLEKHTKKLKDNNKKYLAKEAFKFYIELMIEKKKRKSK